MALLKLVRRNYGAKLLVRIKCQNLHSFNEGVILLCRSVSLKQEEYHSYMTQLSLQSLRDLTHVCNLCPEKTTCTVISTCGKIYACVLV